MIISDDCKINLILGEFMNYNQMKFLNKELVMKRAKYTH